MKEEKLEDNKEQVALFGYLRSRKELLWNGIIFFAIAIAYFTIDLYLQLPSGFRDIPDFLKTFEHENPHMLITLPLMFIGYYLIDKSIFGSDVGKMIEKWGTFGYFLRAFSLAILLIFAYTIVQVITLIFIFL